MKNYATQIDIEAISGNNSNVIDTKVLADYQKYGQLEAVIVYENTQHSGRYIILSGFEIYNCIKNDENNFVVSCIVVSIATAKQIIKDKNLFQVSKKENKPAVAVKTDFSLLGDLTKPQEKYTLQLDTIIPWEENPAEIVHEISSEKTSSSQPQKNDIEPEIELFDAEEFEEDTNVHFEEEIAPPEEKIEAPEPVIEENEITEPVQQQEIEEEDSEEEMEAIMSEIRRELQADIDAGLLPQDFPLYFDKPEQEPAPPIVESKQPKPKKDNKPVVKKTSVVSESNKKPVIFYDEKKKILSYIDVDNQVRNEIGKYLLNQAKTYNLDNITLKDFFIKGNTEGAKTNVFHIKYTNKFNVTYTFWLDKIYNKLIEKFK